MWYVKSVYPDLFLSDDEERIKWLTQVYDPSRIAIRYQLIEKDELIELVWKNSLQAIEQTEDGGGMLLGGRSGAGVTNLKFIATEPLTNGTVELTLAWPTNSLSTNAIDIFVSTNMLEQIWQIALTTNVSTETNTFTWIDTEADVHPARFYDCWTLHDSDSDELSDGRERRLYLTDPQDSDSDNDGMPDGWEVEYGLDPLTYDDPEADYDDDNYINVYEYVHDSDPLSATNVPAPSIIVTNGVTTIQAAINSCNTDYGIVLVKAGTYTNSGNRNIDLGGKRITVVSESGSDTTIIDCQDSGRGFHLHSSETRRTVISGFTIKNGYSFASGLWEMEGGGILCDGSSATLLDCTIEQNRAYIEGGGVYVKNGNPELRNCRLTQNHAGTYGGGIGCGTNCTLVVSGSLVSGNEADTAGGGVSCRSSSSPDFVGSSIVSNSTGMGGGVFCSDTTSVEFKGCTLGWNAATGSVGGGMYCNLSAAPEIYNSLIISNTADSVGGGLDAHNQSDPRIRNCVLLGNHADTAGGGISAYSTVDTECFNTIIWSNTASLSAQLHQVNQLSVTYSDVQGGWEGTGNINTNPAFTRLGYRLTAVSSCIDAGTSSGAPSIDIDGESRSGSPDMGIDEFVDTDGDDMPDLWETEYFDGLSQTGTIDADGDGLSNDAEVYYKTDPDSWDTDGDLMPDGWEVEYGMNPLDDSDASSDTDGDWLDAFEEMRYGTDPSTNHTDGDGVSDYDEIINGSDPADGDDAGNPTNCVSLELVVGDWSGSNSERYELQVGSATIHHVSEGFGTVSTGTYSFVKGKSYPFQVRWIATDPAKWDYDYDYEARIGGLPTGDSGAEWMYGTNFVIHDDQGILGKYDNRGDNGQPNAFDMTGKTGTLSIINAQFIDDIPDYSQETNTDSDNFFLRELDAAGDPDSKELDIYYKIMPSGVEVDDVKIKIYKGDTSTVVATLDGEKDASGNYKTGDNLYTNWTPTLFTQDSDPGFYRLQLQVFAGGSSTPISETPIDDRDTSTPGWQCPQEGLAIHDLVWKHRPIVYLGTGEVVGPPQDPFEALIKPWMRHKNGVDKLDPDSDTSAISPPPTYDAFGSLTSADTESVMEKSDLTANPYFDIHDDHLQAMAAVGNLWHHAPLDVGPTLKHANHAFIQFWMYQPSSHGVFNNAGIGSNELTHEGDWEMCQFTIRLKNPDNPTSKKYWVEPFAATASQHYYGQTLLWDRNHNGPVVVDQDYVQHSVNGNRVVIYIAENAHATYFRGGTIDTDIFKGCGTQIQYASIGAFGYDRVVPASSPTSMQYLPMNDTNIYDWTGDWGQAYSIDILWWTVKRFAGPRSPFYRESQIEDGNPSSHLPLARDPEAFHNWCRKTSMSTAQELR